MLIATRARGASRASASIVRETVGSEATGPRTPGSARSTATSARQSPPKASAIARSSTTFAGSCTALGLRQGANPLDSAEPRPAARTVSTGSTPPVCDTTPELAASVWTRG